MTDPATELSALYELSDGGKAGWWPDVVVFDRDWGMGWSFISRGTPSDSYVRINPQHALDLVRAEAERRLVEKGIEVFRGNANRGGVSYEYYPDPESSTRAWQADTLAEALSHAMEAA